MSTEPRKRADIVVRVALERSASDLVRYLVVSEDVLVIPTEVVLAIEPFQRDTDDAIERWFAVIAHVHDENADSYTRPWYLKSQRMPNAPLKQC